jgi:hypothetical protein
VTSVVADDPYTGKQVRIDPAATGKNVIAPAGFPLASFKVNGFLRNGDADPMSDIRCAAPGKGSMPTHVQIGVFTNANAQRRSRKSFGFGDHDSHQNIRNKRRRCRFINGDGRPGIVDRLFF